MKKITTVLILLTAFLSRPVFAQLENAEKTLIHTQTANTYNPGKIGLYSNMNFYSKVGDFLGDVTPSNFQAVSWWVVAGNAILTYGIMEHLDASVGVRLYQDTHYENEFNVPDDIFVTLKTGSYKFARNRFSQGFMASFRIPTGEQHNYPFVKYASGAFEYGLMYAVSYYADPYLPDRGFNAHFNAGWWNHNEAGTVLYTFPNGNELKATRNSSEYRMALAFVYPTGLFDFRLELTGMLFLEDPDPFVYSAEEWAFLTPSFRYKPADWVAMDLGIDFRVSPAERNNTSGIPQPSDRVDLPLNYTDWTVQLGVDFNFNLLAEQKTSDLSYEQREAKKKIEMFETIVEEREKAESVQDEIENLKKVRKEAEKEIEELKKLLEDD